MTTVYWELSQELLYPRLSIASHPPRVIIKSYLLKIINWKLPYPKSFIESYLLRFITSRIIYSSLQVSMPVFLIHRLVIYWKLLLRVIKSKIIYQDSSFMNHPLRVTISKLSIDWHHLRITNPRSSINHQESTKPRLLIDSSILGIITIIINSRSSIANYPSRIIIKSHQTQDY